jgi:hypothetical protein
MEGRPPLTLKFEHLYERVPLSSAEQRQQFEFPQIRVRVQLGPLRNKSLIMK